VQRFACVRLEFAHAIGPDAGRYVVRPAGEASVRGADPFDVAAVYGKADVLDIGLADAPRAFGRRRRRGSDDAAAEPVQIARVTYIWGTEPLSKGDAAEGLARLAEEEPDVQRRLAHVIATLNVAIRAHRVAVSDPFVTEVSPYDPRRVTFGYGTAERLMLDTMEASWSPPRERGYSIMGHDSADAGEMIAAALAAETRVLESDDLILRVALDLHQGRRRGAAAGVRALADLIEHELGSLEDGGPAIDPRILARAREAGLAVLVDPNDTEHVDRLMESARSLQDALRLARQEGVAALRAPR
jgi:hypothetical protein